MNNVHEEACLSKITVVEWCSKFGVGRNSIQDASRSGRPYSSTTDNNNQAVDDAIREKCRISIPVFLKDRTIYTPLVRYKSFWRDVPK